MYKKNENSSIILGFIIRLGNAEDINYILSKIEGKGEIIYQTTVRPPTRLFITKWKPLGVGKYEQNRKV